MQFPAYAESFYVHVPSLKKRKKGHLWFEGLPSNRNEADALRQLGVSGFLAFYIEVKKKDDDDKKEKGEEKKDPEAAADHVVPSGDGFNEVVRIPLEAIKEVQYGMGPDAVYFNRVDSANALQIVYEEHTLADRVCLSIEGANPDKIIEFYDLLSMWLKESSMVLFEDTVSHWKRLWDERHLMSSLSAGCPVQLYGEAASTQSWLLLDHDGLRICDEVLSLNSITEIKLVKPSGASDDSGSASLDPSARMYGVELRNADGETLHSIYGETEAEVVSWLKGLQVVVSDDGMMLGAETEVAKGEDDDDDNDGRPKTQITEVSVSRQQATAYLAEGVTFQKHVKRRGAQEIQLVVRHGRLGFLPAASADEPQMFDDNNSCPLESVQKIMMRKQTSTFAESRSGKAAPEDCCFTIQYSSPTSGAGELNLEAHSPATLQTWMRHFTKLLQGSMGIESAPNAGGRRDRRASMATVEMQMSMRDDLGVLLAGIDFLWRRGDLASATRPAEKRRVVYKGGRLFFCVPQRYFALTALRGLTLGIHEVFRRAQGGADARPHTAMTILYDAQHNAQVITQTFTGLQALTHDSGKVFTEADIADGSGMGALNIELPSRELLCLWLDGLLAALKGSAMTYDTVSREVSRKTGPIYSIQQREVDDILDELARGVRFKLYTGTRGRPTDGVVYALDEAIAWGNASDNIALDAVLDVYVGKRAKKGKKKKSKKASARDEEEAGMVGLAADDDDDNEAAEALDTRITLMFEDSYLVEGEVKTQERMLRFFADSAELVDSWVRALQEARDTLITTKANDDVEGKSRLVGRWAKVTHMAQFAILFHGVVMTVYSKNKEPKPMTLFFADGRVCISSKGGDNSKSNVKLSFPVEGIDILLNKQTPVFLESKWGKMAQDNRCFTILYQDDKGNDQQLNLEADTPSRASALAVRLHRPHAERRPQDRALGRARPCGCRGRP